MGEIVLLRKAAFLRRPRRYKVLYGGRGGGKSYAIAAALLIEAMRNRHLILCVREFQNSIKDSVHRLLSDQIERCGLKWFFRVTKTGIFGANGSEFIFSGMARNIQSIKSTEGITIAWVEEAQTVSKASWELLTPTVRKNGTEIWVSFNPYEKTDYTYRLFIENQHPESTVVKVGWEDNPWFPETLRKEKDYLYSVDPDAAAHVWGGETIAVSKAQVLHDKWVVEPFEPQEDWGGPYQGADWGFAEDPSVLVRMWIKGDLTSLERELYIEHEAYGCGVDINETPELFDSVPDARKYVTRADSARPETISYVSQHGYPLMESVKKWPGSVEDGVSHLRSYSRIVIHPRCKRAQQEARLWRYKVDPRSGDVLPILVDKHNHIWDSARYGLAPIIQSAGSVTDLTLPIAPKIDREWVL